MKVFIQSTVKKLAVGLWGAVFAGCSISASLDQLGLESYALRKVHVESGTSIVLEEGTAHQITLSVETPPNVEGSQKTTSLGWSINDHGGDFEAASGTLLINPGETSVSFLIKPQKDAWVEGDETFVLTFTGREFENLEENQVTILVKDKTEKAKIEASVATVDFGALVTGSVAEEAITFTNTGDASAAVAWSSLSAPFSYKGGSFPGVGGTCGATIVGHASCTIVVRFEPSSVGTHSKVLSWSYHDPVSAQTGSLGLSGVAADVAAILSGVPSSPSSVGALNVTVSGSDITHYRYKVGSSASTNCTSGSGYSAEQAVGTPISDSLLGFASNQNLKICVVGKDTNGLWQPFELATAHTWSFDIQKPTVEIAQKAGQSDPTKTLPILFTLTLSEPIEESSLTESDISFVGSAVVTSHTLTRFDATHYELAVTGISADGIVEPIISAGKFYDLAGNPNEASTGSDHQVTYDTSAPSLPTTLSWVQSSPTKAQPVTAEWTLSASADVAQQHIQFYKEALCVTTEGTPISLGPSTNTANLSATDGESYSYKITLTDTAGNTVVSGCSSAIVIDRTAPSVLSFAPATGVRSSLPASVVVTWSEGMSQASVEDTNNWEVSCSGSGQVSVTGASLTTSTTATVALNVVTPPEDGEICTLTAKTGLTDLAGNTLSAAANVQYTLDLPGQVLSVTSPLANGVYKSGQVIPISVVFSEAVTVTGSPTLLMETGAVDRTAVYTGGSGTNTLTFEYTVENGDHSSDLDYVSGSALALNGGSIQDSFGSDIILTLPTPGASGSLSASKAIVVDTLPPGTFSITGITGGSDVTADEWLTSGNTPTVKWSEASDVDHYTVEIRSADSSSVVCALATVSTTQHTFTGCTLADNTQYAVRVVAYDEVENSMAASNNNFLFRVNNVAVIATLSGQPTGRTNQAIWEMLVGGADVQSYRYKVGPAASTNCSDGVGYSASIPVGTKITDSTLGLGSTEIKICVLGKNSASVEQLLSSATSATWTQDLIAPTVIVNQAVGQVDPTNLLPIEFAVVFSEEIDPATFTEADITQSGTATGVTWSLSTTDNVTWTLSVTAVASPGTLIPSIAASKVTDLAGNANTASTQTDNTVAYDTTNPTLTINQKSAQADPTNSLPIEFTIVFSEPINPATFTEADITQSGTATGVTWSLNTSDQITWALTATAVGTEGTLIPSVAAGKVADVAGNTNLASTSTDHSVTYDITPPSGATSLGWQQTSPTNSTTLTAQWTKSVSADLASQKVRFYTGNGCDTVTGTEASLSSSATSTNLTSANGSTYTYRVVSIDQAGNESTSACSTALVVDTEGPTITNVTSNKANGAYTSGEVIDIRVTFSEDVTVTGTPLLALNTTPSRSASYVSGSGSDTLVFNYTVQAGDNSADLNYATTNALTVVGATIKDTAGNQASLTLPALVASNSLGSQKDIVIDTDAPVINSFTITSASPTNQPDLTITSTVSGSPVSYCILENNTSVGACTWQSGSSLSSTFTVSTVNGSKTLSAWVKDLAGNVSARASAGPVVFDSVPPTATLAGHPTGTTAVYALNINVGGTDVVAYKYKVGLSASTDCSVATGYSAEAPETTKITADISGLENGTIRLCVVGRDQAGNWQANADATTVTWVKNSPSIQFTQASTSVPETDGASLSIEVSLSAVADVDVTVSYSFSDGPSPAATLGKDYNGTGGTLTIPSGQTTTTISATVLDDDIEEHDEKFQITLHTPVGGKLGTNEAHTVTIEDDEDTPLLAIQDVYVIEGESTQLLVTLSRPTEKGPVTFTWTKDACAGVDCASEGTDYTLSSASGTMAIPPGETSLSFSHLMAVDNTADELYKRIPLLVTSVSGATAYLSNANIFINDNDFSSGKEAVKIAVAYKHTCAVTSNGNVYCWGDNSAGVLGVGNQISSSVPVKLSLTNVVDIGASGQFSCALRSNGSVYCWGVGSYAGYLSSMLGHGSLNSSTSPVQVSGMSSGVTQLAVGNYNACVIKAGAVHCWGDEYYGVVPTINLIPVAITSLSSGVEKVSLGGDHACALKTNGSVYCWGRNDAGQLGIGHTTDTSTPTQVLGVGSIVDIWAGMDTTCAKNSTGQVYCWGDNSYRQISELATASFATPVLVPDYAGATEIAVSYLTCAVLGGSLKCQGMNNIGQMGLNRMSRSGPEPLSDVIGGSSNVTSVNIGWGDMMCFIRSGQPYCTGVAGDGQLGDQRTLRSDGFVLSPLLSGASALEVQTSHTCGLFGGAFKCLGSNSSRALGNLLPDRYYLAPAPITGLESGVSQFAMSSNGSCVLKDGAVFCLGIHLNGSTTSTATPRLMPGLESGVTDLAASIYIDNACAVKGGKLYCWGQYLSYSQFDRSPGVYEPYEVTSAGSNIVAVAIGKYHGCVLKSDQTVWCSGYNGSGQLGQGNSNGGQANFVKVPGLTGVDEISASDSGVCARIGTSSLKCWGYGPGQGSTSSNSPVTVSATNISALRSGRWGHCVIESGALKCWGENMHNIFGVSGYTSMTFYKTPISITALNSIGSVEDVTLRGEFGLCGKIGSNWYCSGINSSAHLGWGDKPYRLAPVSVAPFPN